MKSTFFKIFLLFFLQPNKKISSYIFSFLSNFFSFDFISSKWTSLNTGEYCGPHTEENSRRPMRGVIIIRGFSHTVPQWNIISNVVLSKEKELNLILFTLATCIKLVPFMLFVRVWQNHFPMLCLDLHKIMYPTILLIGHKICEDD